ncbi:MAG TPA: MarR family transcriptional regulator [Gaiellaceae bacterium]|nr:MarR family transcriptional regulator [Gaiellaceae bacterium]
MSELTRDNLGFLLAKASQRWNELLVDSFQDAGFAEVRASFGSVLVPLFEEDGLRMGELARRSGLSKQAMTTLVRMVEEAGLVTRERDAADGRAIRVSLSPRGEELRPHAERAVAEAAGWARERLSSAELTLLIESLRKVVQP